tara:strand:- start:117 stop:395 length:279 start_codon:yes stop_codon:yes gene_type:complete
MAKYILDNGVKREMTSKEEQEGFLTAKELEADSLKALRNTRNILLAETDYMGNSDVTMSAKWKTYRQELRDITKTFKSMSDKDFKFPEKPTE